MPQKGSLKELVASSFAARGPLAGSAALHCGGVYFLWFTPSGAAILGALQAD